jgi:hypothetical protein
MNPAIIALLIIQTNGQSSIFKTTVPRPTGKNGYEEYVRAAEIVTSPECSFMMNYDPKSPTPPQADEETPSDKFKNLQKTYQKVLGKTPLQIRRLLYKDFGRALELVRLGNAKPIFPTRPITMETLFPEYSAFKRLVKYGVMCSDSLIADGRTGEAAKVLVDLFTMAKNIQRDTLIGLLVGISCESILMASIQNHMEHLSEVDWKYLESSAREFLSSANPIPQIMLTELSFLDSLKREPKETLRFFLNDDNSSQRAKSVIAKLQTMSKAEASDLVQDAITEIKTYSQLVIRTMDAPESEWGNVPDLTDASDATWLGQQLQPDYRNVLGAYARIRTQLRILKLHSLVQMYRWHWNELPKSLEIITGPKERFDPLSQFEFMFEIKGSGYRIYSKGSKTTGEIELIYRRNNPSETPLDLPPLP